ncbi:CD22 molecule [Rhinolophus ferrumequinum]|uniref:CD22 molecule n=1 Tax=Rhinolophus ferrumequinum TaxID=59479 RepID=A0A7J7SH41_RHIFE|nr:CD22 molecule [Rhinolophus ferrumequinum]
MYLLGPSLLLLEYLAFSDSRWVFKHPKTLYAWEGACVWIPCSYRIAGHGKTMDTLVVYHNYTYDEKAKEYHGKILCNKTKTEELCLQESVKFLGDIKSNCTLSIQPVQAQDNGLLGLRMTSEAGKWMENIFLNISQTAPPPHIQLPPEIQESREVSVTCSLNFSCPGYEIKLKWSLNGLPQYTSVPSTSLTTEAVSTQSKLTFEPKWFHHGKNLTCQLWNDISEGLLLSQETVQLDVKHTPKLMIEVHPRDTIVTKGDSVTMTCQINSSNPEPTNMYWFKDGSPLREPRMLQSAQKRLTLTLSNVTKEMGGHYYCVAHNDIGSERSQEVALQVRYAPEPSKVQISPSPAKEGGTVVLTCLSPANPPPTNYTWFHNRIEVPRKTSMTFQILKVLLKHAGNYSCWAVNSLGRGYVGQEAELDVQYSPKEVTTVIQNPTPIREGDNVTLLCHYTSSNPSVTRYEWKSEGSWNEPEPGVLMIQKVAWNAKPFTCAACNQWCSWASPVDLHVQYAPKGVKVLPVSPRREIHSGHQVLLQCNFSSSCPTDVRFFWKKNGIFLEEGKQLSFDSVSPEDAGNYNCLVNNSIGQSMSEAWTLQVLYAPRKLRVSISPKDSVMEGKKAVLTCESDANPPVSQYTWFDGNNQNLQHYHQMLILNSVKVQQSGAYRCQGTNRLGVGQSPPSTLTVYYSPETIGRRVALGVMLCLVAVLLAFWGVKLQRSWKRIQSQQELQENSNGQSFFVRNKKVRRVPLAEGSHALGCYNPVIEDTVSYAALRFPVGETDTPRIGDAREQRPSLHRDNTVTYSVVQKPQTDDYENVTPAVPEDEGIHYSELIHLGVGERPMVQDTVEYVTLKH